MMSQYKAQARQALHDALGEPASYTDSTLVGPVPTPEQTEAGLALTVRWHTRQKLVGERGNDDAAVIEGINRLVFNADNLTALGLTLRRNGLVTVPGYGKTFRLDYHEESDGPLNTYWTVIEL